MVVLFIRCLVLVSIAVCAGSPNKNENDSEHPNIMLPTGSQNENEAPVDVDSSNNLIAEASGKRINMSIEIPPRKNIASLFTPNASKLEAYQTSRSSGRRSGKSILGLASAGSRKTSEQTPTGSSGTKTAENGNLNLRILLRAYKINAVMEEFFTYYFHGLIVIDQHGITMRKESLDKIKFRAPVATELFALTYVKFALTWTTINLKVCTEMYEIVDAAYGLTGMSQKCERMVNMLLWLNSILNIKKFHEISKLTFTKHEKGKLSMADVLEIIAENDEILSTDTLQGRIKIAHQSDCIISDMKKKQMAVPLHESVNECITDATPKIWTTLITPFGMNLVKLQNYFNSVLQIKDRFDDTFDLIEPNAVRFEFWQRIIRTFEEEQSPIENLQEDTASAKDIIAWLIGLEFEQAFRKRQFDRIPELKIFEHDGKYSDFLAML